MKKSMKILGASILAGAVLGVICIIGGSLRAGGFAGNEIYLLGMWYNRLVIGLAMGLAAFFPWQKQNPLNCYSRALLIGLGISFAFYLSSGFRDPIAFLAGGVYAVIIAWITARMMVES